ncbi:hypothetical protein PIB30_045756 [Stylosanthes scabra]|uniref:Uncharacterized protein n=1 Tax=Stylosanthes scabra TaxID=79078 RepID=A0ABU6SG41_9FABA|nr:hypothetical protein [Stylosanthes scabra]
MNKSEVTLKRAIMIHAIMKSKEVRAERLIEETMSEIVTALHLDKPPLAFPNVIARLCEAASVPTRPITAAVKENLRHPHQQPQQHQQFHGRQDDQEQYAAYAAQVPQGFPEPQGYGWGQLQQDMATLRLN